MIIESIITTLDAKGIANFAPMGVGWGEQEIVVKPYRETTTYRNLLETGEAVVNLVDDVLFFVKGALSSPSFPSVPASVVRGVVLEARPRLAARQSPPLREAALRAAQAPRTQRHRHRRGKLGRCRSPAPRRHTGGNGGEPQAGRAEVRRAREEDRDQAGVDRQEGDPAQARQRPMPWRVSQLERIRRPRPK